MTTLKWRWANCYSLWLVHNRIKCMTCTWCKTKRYTRKLFNEMNNCIAYNAGKRIVTSHGCYIMQRLQSTWKYVDRCTFERLIEQPFVAPIMSILNFFSEADDHYHGMKLPHPNGLFQKTASAISLGCAPLRQCSLISWQQQRMDRIHVQSVAQDSSLHIP